MVVLRLLGARMAMHRMVVRTSAVYVVRRGIRVARALAHGHHRAVPTACDPARHGRSHGAPDGEQQGQQDQEQDAEGLHGRIVNLAPVARSRGNEPTVSGGSAAYSAPMNTIISLVLPLALVSVSFDAAATELVPLDWSADGRFTKELAVPAGKFVEACGKLPAKTKVRWNFEAGGALDFNIHFHVGKKVLFPAKKDHVTKAGDTLDTKVEQDYCWMWTNKSSHETTLMFDMARE